MGSPFPGSPGVATIGSTPPASISIVAAYSAPASLYNPSHSARTSAAGTPRRPAIQATAFSSGAMTPVKPPTSAAMFVSVARSSIDRASTASPVNSMMRPIASPLLTVG